MNDKQLFDSIYEHFIKALEDTERQYSQLCDDYAPTLTLVLLSTTYSVTKDFCGEQYARQRKLVTETLDHIHRIDTRLES